MKTTEMRPFITIKEIRALIAENKINKKEILQFYIDRLRHYDDQLGSMLEVFDQESVVEITANHQPLNAPLLDGVPGAIKDNICLKGRKTSCASKILENYVAPYDATASERLLQHGALLLGRANCDEFAMGSSTETSAFKKTKNPWDLNRVPGGSSGGSIAAVAAGLVPFSLGSETGGSVRQPAAFCGIVGLKPTYGLISRYGLIAYASSLDQIGIATHTVYDNALVLSAIAGKDVRDATTIDPKVSDYTKLLDGEFPTNITIGVVDSALYADGMDSEIVTAIEQAIATFFRHNIAIKKVAIPSLEYAAAAYFIISRAEAASNLARFDGVRYGFRSNDAESLKEIYLQSRTQGFGHEVRARIMVGNYVLSAGHAEEFYQHARMVQQALHDDFLKAFASVDLLILPTHPIPAFRFGAFSDNKLQMDLQDYFTCGINLARIPALALPCGFTKENLPIGMQLVGPHSAEELLFRVGHAYQQVTDWHQKHPKMDF